MPIATRLTERLGIVHPVISAPMDVIAGNVSQVQEYFNGKLPFAVRLPEVPQPLLKSLGGRVTHLRDRDAAYVRYDMPRGRVSVFVYEDTDDDSEVAPLYVVGNRGDGKRNVGVVRRGSPTEGGWTTLAETEPYPISGTQFDHLFNGVVVSPDGAWVFVNSGSRTDHGEVQDNDGSFPDAREGALTSRIFRLPADGEAITLPDDEAAVAPYVFARGARNAGAVRAQSIVGQAIALAPVCALA